MSQFGDKLDYIALIAIIGLFPKRQVPFLLSQLAVFITLPVLIFGPVAGVLVDRWHKKRVMVICDTLRTGCAIMIPIVFILTHNIYPVFAVVFLMFLLGLFFNTARSAIIPNLVSRKRILTANSVINFIGRGATFLGMFLGGLIVDWRFWKVNIGVEGWTAALLQRNLSQVWDELRHAIQMILKSRNLAFAMSTIFLMIMGASVIYVLAIPTIQKEMAWGTSGVGILAGIGAIGLLLGAYLTGIFGHHFDLKYLMLFCFIVIGTVLVLFPFARHFWTFAIGTLIAGIVISPIFIGQDTLIHHYADELIRGRVFSLRDWILNGSFLLWALLIGFLANFVKKNLLFAIFGIAMAVLSISGWLVLARGKGVTVSPDNT
ncbi:hypothetical protein BXT86_04505 [candidate division WOR-3 bacterium 4484_100]|uniref:Major facilitator superfamily (MFS) profile domain-containing protein n=1 Tax=candidate division WOR-3 bacterium 4484_100 TaxID=1936077 RepID=A0A1V4QEN6_UNCW3|nr:MAG: hypothetical protein BXT86_04505 [candidate division WOR-3 bacterium 4484_100]